MAQVSPSRTGILGRPDYMAQVLGIDPAWTAQASLREDSARQWRGLHRSAHDAVCPECIKESAHLRAHWEHAYAVACSHHRIQLVDRCSACTEMLSSSRERIEQCQCGQDLRQLPVAPATKAQLWLAGLLASEGTTTMGVEPQVEGVPIAALSKLVRTLCLLAEPDAPNPRRNAAAPQAVQEAVEFLGPVDDLLSDWPVGFEAHVSERIAAGDAQARTLNSLLGRWYQQLKAVCAVGPLQPFMACVMKVAASEFDGILGLDAAGSVAGESNSHMLLKQAAKQLGVSRDRLLSLVAANQLQHRTRRFGTRGVAYEIPISEVDRIHAARVRWVSEATACEALGVPPAALAQMVAANLLMADPGWRADILKSGPVEGQSMERLATVLKSHQRKTSEGGERIALKEFTSRRMGDKKAIQAALQAILRGGIACIGGAEKVGGLQYRLSDVRQHFSTPILESGLSVHQLAKLTGWKWESVSYWIDEGLLDSVPVVLRGQPCRVVLPEHLIKFHSTYVPLTTLAHSLNARSSELLERLGGIETLGGKPLASGAVRGALVRLSDLAQAALLPGLREKTSAA